MKKPLAHCKDGGHVQATQRAEVAKHSGLYRFLGSGTASSGAAGAAAAKSSIPTQASISTLPLRILPCISLVQVN